VAKNAADPRALFQADVTRLLLNTSAPTASSISPFGGSNVMSEIKLQA